MPNKTFDTIAGCVFLIVGMFFIVASTGISASSYGSKVGPNIFPTALGAILVLLSVIVIAQALRIKPAAKEKGQKNYKRFAMVLSSTFLYILLFEPLGYVISTFLYLVFVFQVMERKKPLYAILIAAFFSAAVYTVYVVVLQGTLPPFPEWLIGGERG
jgi:putative tricarboxylic transport membrane protein